ncbi:hypothetical protein ASG29_11515 [Sphingomonas sp. Leaf412]|uniref:hypothetical protein n=1 Tax=Sphingomonas sp. Leaf412 TaxID=1736370 RepID=UPI0006F4325E|nr:hypothetical protein [Sphingomonas sp. Leaf412]KQT32409.1 hypothetical protein ASG29_11515 [Sphingomonas sp. Leaf412]
MAAVVSVAAALVAGCGMAGGGAGDGAQAREGGDVAAIRIARDFMDRRGEPLALVRAAGARVDESLAGSGNYPFEAPHVAARGSALAIDEGGTARGAPETLTLRLPADTHLSFSAATRALGEAKRAPALPGRTWTYLIAAPKGRYRLTLSGDPERPGAHVTEVAAIRER